MNRTSGVDHRSELGNLRREATARLLKSRLSPLIVALMLLPMNSLLLHSQEKESVVVVRMTNDMKFIPNNLTIRVSQTVKWVNEAEEGGTLHNVTTDPEKVMEPKHVSIPDGAKPFDSGNINPGRSFTYTFTVPGVYKYACAPHEGMMRGEVTVEP